MLTGNFSEYRAEVRGEREIAPLVELLRLETGPLAVHLLAVHAAADHEQRARVSVVRAAIAVLPHRAPEFRHRHDDDVRHAITEIGDERRDRLREVGQTRRELTRRAALVHMRVP